MSALSGLARGAAAIFPKITPALANRFFPEVGAGVIARAPSGLGIGGIPRGISWASETSGLGKLPAIGRVAAQPFRSLPKTSIFGGLAATPLVNPTEWGDDYSSWGNVANDIGMFAQGIPAPVTMPLLPTRAQAPVDIGKAYGQYNKFLTTSAGPEPVAPDYLSIINDPSVQTYVNSVVSAMQRPYVRASKKRERLGGEQAQSLADMGAESRRVSRALRKEDEASRKAYSRQAKQREVESADMLGDIYDRLLGESTLPEQFATERGEQAAESVSRVREATEREARVGTGGSLDTATLMRNMDTVDQIQTAQDIRDAREQTRLDTEEIDAKIADIAAQSPELARQFASDLYQSEANKYQSEVANYRAKLGAVSDFYVQYLDNISKGSESDFNLADWVNAKANDVSASGKLKSPDQSSEIDVVIKPIERLQSDPVAWQNFLGNLTAYTSNGYDPTEVAEMLYGQYQAEKSPEWEAEQSSWGKVAE